MQRRNRKTWADIPAGHEDPLSYAVTTRNRSTMEMVEDAVRRKRVLLAYQSRWCRRAEPITWHSTRL